MAADQVPTRVEMRTSKALTRFSWVTLALNIGVIAWGAYVRATGSGAGCGSHWPLCNGTVLPRTASSQTLIEYTHRLTSGLAFFAVVVLVIWCWRATSKGAWPRWSVAFALAGMLNEALLGALLVKFNYVGQNASVARAVFLSLHFANTLFLLACLAVSAYLLSGRSRNTLAAKKSELFLVAVSLLAIAIVGVTGSLAALGDTLFPAPSLTAAFHQDLASTSFYLLRLRFLHPLAALLGASYVVWLLLTRFRRSQRLVGISTALGIVLALQVGIGAANVLLLAPVWLQLVHLVAGDTLWITLVLLSADFLLVEPLQHA